MSADLRAALEPLVESGAVPGVVASWTSAAEPEPVVLGARAPRGEPGSSPMTADTIFRIASATKPVMGVLTAALVDDGRLSLDDEVVRWVPELAETPVLRSQDGPLDDVVPTTTPLTLRHVVAHTSGHGFPWRASDWTELLVERLLQSSRQLGAVPPPDEWVRRLATIPRWHQPGDGWTYNASYDLLGVVLARATGTSLEQLLAERLLEPLGMVDTGFHVPAEQLDRFATLCAPDDDEPGGLRVVDRPDGEWSRPPAFPSGAGGLVSTLADLHRLGRMINGGGELDGVRLMSEDAARLLRTDLLDGTQREAAGGFLDDGQGWAMGGSVDAPAPGHALGRFGWVGGTGTALYADPADGSVSILLTQVELGGPEGAPAVDAFLGVTKR